LAKSAGLGLAFNLDSWIPLALAHPAAFTGFISIIACKARGPVRAAQPKPTRALPPQDGHLMPKRDNKFQGRAATKSE
jgi:hypothetical protein